MNAASQAYKPESERGKQPFSVRWQGDVALFRFGVAPLHFAADLAVRDQLLREFDRCSQSDLIKVVVLIGSPEKAGSREYERFYQNACEPHEHRRVTKMLNVFNQVIVALVNLKAFVIFADSGRVISQFINLGLACDYRIIGDNTLIEKAYLRQGMLPKGGGALLLSRQLGRSKAWDLLLSEQGLTAAEAMELGLVDEVVPAAELEVAALRAAGRFAAKPATTLLGIKCMLNYDLRDLADYLDFENHQILLGLRRATY